MKNFTGQRVLITGGAAGLGKKMALLFAEKGAEVVVWDIDEAGLKRLQEEINRKNLKIHGYKCDISNRNTVYETADRVRKEVGEIDILINNAGIVSGKPFIECNDEQVERTMAVNTMSVFWMTRAFLSSMIERDRGYIVNIASAAGLIGVAGLADYAASKFGVFGFDESIRMELRKRGSSVKTMIVCPFYINTGMFDGVKTRFPILLPILDEEKTARKIIKAVAKGKKRLCMPWIVYTVPLLRILPVKAFDWIASFLGVHDSMDEFKGRKM